MTKEVVYVQQCDEFDRLQAISNAIAKRIREFDLSTKRYEPQDRVNMLWRDVLELVEKIERGGMQ